MLEVLGIHSGLHLLDDLGMNIDDKKNLTELITTTTTSNNNELDMI